MAKVIFLHLSVIHSVHRGGLPQCMLGYPPPEQTSPPGSRLQQTVNTWAVRILLECNLVTIVIKCVIFIVIRIAERKWICNPFCLILSIIHTVTIGTMLNLNGDSNGPFT